MARRILGEDVTQIDYYTERFKRMVGRVRLQRHHPLQAGRLWIGGRHSRRLLRSSRAERLKLRREQLSAQDASISGWNLALNSGEAAEQTVFHAHFQRIQRREGDCEEPRGGVWRVRYGG